MSNTKIYKECPFCKHSTPSGTQLRVQKYAPYIDEIIALCEKNQYNELQIRQHSSHCQICSTDLKVGDPKGEQCAKIAISMSEIYWIIHKVKPPKSGATPGRKAKAK
jgi:hypothetical protein